MSKLRIGVGGAGVRLRVEDQLECWTSGSDIAGLWIWLRIVGVEAGNHAGLV
jgi:hypothetical protein